MVGLPLRTLVLTALVVAAAEMPGGAETSDRLTVIYLLDQSFSIPAAKRRAMIDYVNAEVKKHRAQASDRAGVIVFGREASIEIPPFDDEIHLGASIEGLLDPECTNLAAAMKLAQATFPEDSARRIVLVSDGNQNQGNALEQAQALAAAGMGINVVPVRYYSRAEVAVERVILPGDIRRGQPFDVPHRALQQLRSQVGRQGRRHRPAADHPDRQSTVPKSCPAGESALRRERTPLPGTRPWPPVGHPVRRVRVRVSTKASRNRRRKA